MSWLYLSDKPLQPSCKVESQNKSETNSSLLVKRQNDNTSPGAWPRHKGSKFRYTIVRQFSRGAERIREDILVPDSLGERSFSCRHQSSLLVKRQNDNTSLWDWPRKISP